MVEDLLIYLSLCLISLWSPFIPKHEGKIQPKETQNTSPSDRQIQENDSTLFHKNRLSLIQEGNWEGLINLHFNTANVLFEERELEELQKQKSEAICKQMLAMGKEDSLTDSMRKELEGY